MQIWVWFDENKDPICIGLSIAKLVLQLTLSSIEELYRDYMVCIDI